jgi:hypothetical protein
VAGLEFSRFSDFRKLEWKSLAIRDMDCAALTVTSFNLPRLWLVALFGVLVGQGLLKAQPSGPSGRIEIVVSVAEQRLALLEDGVIVKKFPISTSKFGLGDACGSYKTPVGRLRVWSKLGDDLPEGAVFRHRNFSGEVLAVNAPGRDPIVTRILWLEGAEPGNQNARRRGIYIHGTPQESSLGKAGSYGCIRMRSRDVVEIFDAAPLGTLVTIVAKKLPRAQRTEPFTLMALLAHSRSQRGS